MSRQVVQGADSMKSLLQEVGFVQAGGWTLDGEGIAYNVDDHLGKERNVLYAFVSGEEVLYIGKTVRMVVERMQNYRTPGSSQRTNIAGKRRIIDLLARGDDVEIWVLAFDQDAEYKGVPLNVAAGLEDGLIGMVRPPWNGSTKG